MGRKKEKSIVVRFDEEEYIKLKNKIGKAKMSQQEYCSKVLLDKNITVIEGYNEFRLEVKRVGVNLNQIAKSNNLGLEIDSELRGVLKELKNIWQQLNVFLRNHQ